MAINCYCFNLRNRVCNRAHGIKVWMSEIIAEVAQASKHCTHAEVAWQVRINISSFYTIWAFKTVLLYNVLNWVLPVSDSSLFPIYHYTSTWRSSSSVVSMKKFSEFLNDLRADTLSGEIKFRGRNSPTSKQKTMNSGSGDCVWWTTK